MSDNTDSQQQPVQHNQGQYQPAQQPPPQQGYGQPQQPAQSFQQHPPQQFQHPQQQYGGQYIPPKKKMPTWKVILIVCGVLFIGLPAGCFMLVGLASIPPKKERPTKPEKVVATDTPKQVDKNAATVSAHTNTVYADYLANEIAADRKYKGTYTILGGVPLELKKGMFGSDMLVTFKAGKNKVICDLKASEEAAASELSTKSFVLIKGKCTGLLWGDVYFTDCTVLGSLTIEERGSMTAAQVDKWMRVFPELERLLEENSDDASNPATN